MKTAGVYAIFLTGTPFVYVGHSQNVEDRWRQHRDKWVWPSPAEYVLVRDMPGSTSKKRMRAESALMRLLRRRGYFLLSQTVEDLARNARRAVEAMTKEQRSARIKLGWSTLSKEERSARMRGLASQTREQRVAAGKASAAKFTADELAARGRKGIRAMRASYPKETLSLWASQAGQSSAQVPNSGRFKAMDQP